MKYIGPYDYAYEDGEPVMRSCYECNPSHYYLKNVNKLHCCFECGRTWLLGKFLSEMTDDEIENFIKDNQHKLCENSKDEDIRFVPDENSWKPVKVKVTHVERFDNSLDNPVEIE